jgi:hypothetical protein
VGRVYNGDNPVPDLLTTSRTRSGIKTDSVPTKADSFNELYFEDEQGKEQVYLRAQRDKTVLVKNQRSTTVGANDTLSVGGDRKATITGNLSVTVGTKGGKYVLDCSDSAELKAPKFIELRCEGSVIHMTPTAITIKAGDGAQIVLDKTVYAQATDGAGIVLDANVSASAAEGANLQLDANAALTGAQVSIKGDTLLEATAAQVKINS